MCEAPNRLATYLIERLSTGLSESDYQHVFLRIFCTLEDLPRDLRYEKMDKHYIAAAVEWSAESSGSISARLTEDYWEDTVRRFLADPAEFDLNRAKALLT